MSQFETLNSKRQPNPPLKQLTLNMEEAENSLESLLETSVGSIEHDKDALQLYVKNIKLALDKYDNLSHTAIISYSKNGAASYAESIRLNKIKLRKQVKETVACATSLLEGLGHDDTISEVATECNFGTNAGEFSSSSHNCTQDSLGEDVSGNQVDDGRNESTAEDIPDKLCINNNVGATSLTLDLEANTEPTSSSIIGMFNNVNLASSSTTHEDAPMLLHKENTCIFSDATTVGRYSSSGFDSQLRQFPCYSKQNTVSFQSTERNEVTSVRFANQGSKPSLLNFSSGNSSNRAELINLQSELSVDKQMNSRSIADSRRFSSTCNVSDINDRSEHSTVFHNTEFASNRSKNLPNDQTKPYVRFNDKPLAGAYSRSFNTLCCEPVVSFNDKPFFDVNSRSLQDMHCEPSISIHDKPLLGPYSSKSIYNDNCDAFIANGNKPFSSAYSRSFSVINNPESTVRNNYIPITNNCCNSFGLSNHREPVSSIYCGSSRRNCFETSHTNDEPLHSHGGVYQRPLYHNTASSDDNPWNHPPDPASFYLIKQQLFQKSTSPFMGEPQKFNSWMQSLENKISGLQLSSWDKLLVLEANTDKEPLALVQKHISLGGLDPDATLRTLMYELKREFGSTIRIANAINQQIDHFPPVKSINHIDRLKDLLNLCQHIEANLKFAEELAQFNTASGMLKIWMKLPEVMQNAWRSLCDDHRSVNFDRYPSFASFVLFLQKKVREYSDPLFRMSSRTDEPRKREQSRTSLKTEETQLEHISTGPTLPETEFRQFNKAKNPYVTPCFLHEKGTHALAECNQFAKMPHKGKIELLRKKGLCFRCLGRHLQASCSATLVCNECGEKHLTVMHFNNTEKTYRTQTSDTERRSYPFNLCTSICGERSFSKSCSKTLLVDISLDGREDKKLRAYAIIDEQSSSSFADPKVAEYFGVTGPIVDYSLKTLNGSSTTTKGVIIEGLKVKGEKEKKNIRLPPTYTNDFIPCSKLEVATPKIVYAHRHLRHLANKFSELDQEAEVLLLIGRDSGESMFTRCFGNKAPYAHHTSLGWALVGKSCDDSPDDVEANVFHNNGNVSLSRHSCFRQEVKWTLPDIDVFEERRDDELVGLSKNDVSFLRTVSNEISINKAGNIVLPLPFKEKRKLPDNHREVYYRTRNTLQRLEKNSQKLQPCIETMNKYISAGHVEQVPPSEIIPKCPGSCWWIPIFPVTQHKKGKTRLVFDSSAKFHGTSLNEQLLQGPDVNNKLKDVLVGFRNGVVGFAADVEYMFHNFILKPEDRDFTRFYWFKNNSPTQGITQYRATVHIFGNTCSPALANLGIRFAVAHAGPTKKHVEEFVNSQFYVDDGLSSSASAKEAIEVLRDTIEVLKRFNIRLHKISSSFSEVVEAFPPSERATLSSERDLESTSLQTALGLVWNTSTDEIVIRSAIPDRPFTRRGVLATVNAVFDPLGISAPVVLEGKLMQRMFLSSVPGKNEHNDWDNLLPEEHESMWNEWKASLKELSGLAIPRSYIPIEFGRVKHTQLHAFCDASLYATGTVIYIRSLNESGESHVSFVTGNAKVAPRATTSIPRLELCSALDVSLATFEVANKLEIPTADVCIYSDSMITLGYIRNKEKKFSRYVTRRVDTILKLFPAECWRYVPSNENPADVATRKQSIQSLSQSSWLRGPEFLWLGLSPTDCNESPELPEMLPDATSMQTSLKQKDSNTIADLILRHSILDRLIRIMLVALIFAKKLRDHARETLGISCVSQGRPTHLCALRILIRTTQQESLPSATSNSLWHQKLSSFTDSYGIIRVGGRLSLADLDYDNKHPVLLPSKHHFTTIVVRKYHEEVKHQGRCITLSAIRQAGYYIHKASSTVRKIINQCVTCRKLRLPLSSQKMSDLPSDRLQCAPPFSFVGMDAFGPYNVTDGSATRRTTSTKKCWAVVFTCLSSRALHIEPLPYLDVSSMKNAMRRFFCIRGPCKKLRSDHGSNFVAARNQEQDLLELKKEIESKGCEWELNPPKASHFGGVWERQIKSVKSILNTCLFELGARVLTRDDLYTFLQECASIVNSTPLWEFSQDPNDPQPLSPGMLLNLKSGVPSTEDEFEAVDNLAYGSKRWRRVQYLSDQFWSRWRNDFLQSLQKRSKWIKESRNLNVGDIVLMKDKTCKRYLWPMGKIIHVKKSTDGLVRSATLLVSSRNGTANRTLERPVTELAILVPNEPVPK